MPAEFEKSNSRLEDVTEEIDRYDEGSSRVYHHPIYKVAI